MEIHSSALNLTYLTLKYGMFNDSEKNHIYGVAVIGLGIHGSSTVANLSTRGLSVVGFDKFGKGGHSSGSSHGRSRIIRQAYFEDHRCTNTIMLNIFGFLI